MIAALREGPDAWCSSVTRGYIGLMLSGFLLLCGPYTQMVLTKYVLFLALGGGYVLCMLGGSLWMLISRRRRLLELLRLHRLPLILAGLYLLLTLLSALLSPYSYPIWMGMTRREGVLTQMLYVLSFSGVLLYGRLRKWHVFLFGFSLLLFCAVCWLQFLGLNPLWLYPKGRNYYGGNVVYNGQFLGTLGNAGLSTALLAVGAGVLLRDGPVRDTVAQAIQQDEIQVVYSTLTPGGYPSIRVKEGVPVRWIITAPEGSVNGCNYKLLIQAYDLEHEFHEGENILEFTPTESGTVPFSCWMGMLQGNIYVEES